MQNMPERDSYSPGTPCWVELGSSDLDAGVPFYEGLFGWNVAESMPDTAATAWPCCATAPLPASRR